MGCCEATPKLIILQQQQSVSNSFMHIITNEFLNDKFFYNLLKIIQQL